MRLRVFWLLLCGSLISQYRAIQDPADPQRARVSGTVLDERGRRAAGVAVKAAPLGGGALTTVLPHTRTDANGRFALAGLLAGRTYVNAYDEQAFYPDASSNFWDGQGGAEIKLPVGGEVSDIVLRLTPVGRLEIKARNAVTGEIIGQTGARLERDGAPNRCMSGGRQGNWWLVPTAPIRLLVMAGAGFQPAWYGGDGSFEKSVPITLARRQVFTARVSLQPRSWHDPASHVFVAQPAAALFRQTRTGGQRLSGSSQTGCGKLDSNTSSFLAQGV